MSSYQQRFSVSFDYPVLFTRDAFDLDHSEIADTIDRLDEKKQHRVIAFLDAGLVEHHKDLPDRVVKYCKHNATRIDLVRAPTVVTGGEAIKNDYRLVMEILDTILEYQLCRHSVVLAIGGGAVDDGGA